MLNQQNSTSEIADLILRNGKIYTVNESQVWAEAVAIKDDTIIFVGTDEAVAEYLGPETQIMDLGGRMAMPGIHDVHMHPLEAGSTVGGTCLLSSGVSPEEFIPELRRCAPKQIGTDWVLGFGHSVYDLLESGRLPLDILDEAIPDKPAIMLEETSHSVWVNSQALKAANIDENTPDPAGGIIDRDPDTGELTGILFENAGNILLDLAFAPSAELDELNYEGLLYSLDQIAKNGITSIVDARTYWQRDHQKAWQRALDEGKLTARTVSGLWAYPHMDDDEQLEKLAALYDNSPDSLLRVTQVKMYSDGIIINGTSALLEPYEEDLLGLPGNVGMSYFDETRLTRYVTELEQAGFDLHIHAIGDRAARETLNAIEAAQNANDSKAGRHRLTHVEMVHEDDRARFAELGVIADFQVAGHFTLPAHAEEAAELLGDRAFDTIPVRSIYDTGAMITLSSDWDVSALSPFVGMKHALIRGDQSLPDLHAVIRAYTLNGAYLMRQEDRTGSIEVGKWADIIVLNQNLFEATNTQIGTTKALLTMHRNLFEATDTQIGTTKVLLTMLGGEVIYSAHDFYVENEFVTPTRTLSPTATAAPSSPAPLPTGTPQPIPTAMPTPTSDIDGTSRETPIPTMTAQPDTSFTDDLSEHIYLPLITK